MYRFLTLLSLCCIAAPTTSQTPSPLDAKTRTGIDALFAEWNKTTSPGCSLGVYQNGHIAYARGYGMADLERDVTLTSRSVFDIASTSKQFVAMSILLLEHDGKLTLDDNICKHVPEMPGYADKITIRHLIHHTSGIRDYLTLMSLAGMPFEHDYPEPQIVALLARQRALNFAPGSEHLYSNSGYFLLSEIVHRVSGLTQGEFAAKRIFAPLGMRHSQFYDDFKRVVRHRAIGYTPRDDGFATELYLFDLVGDGGTLTNVEDLLAWDRNFYDNKLGGGQTLIENMLTPGRLNDGSTLQYACALTVSEHRGLQMVSHGGAWAGYRAEFIRFPAQKLSVAVLSNLGTFRPTQKALQVADILLAGVMHAQPAAALGATEDSAFDSRFLLDKTTLMNRVGAYRDTDSGRYWRLTMSGNELSLATNSGNRFKLVAIDAHTFRAANAPVSVVLTFAGDADSSTMEVSIEEETPRRFKRVDFVTPTAAQLGEYAGRYLSTELQVTYRITVDKNRLVVGLPYQPEARDITPTVKDEFVTRGQVVRFARKGKGRITGFAVDAGRVRNIEFVRVQ